MRPQGMFADPFAPAQPAPFGAGGAPAPTDPFPVATPSSPAPFHDPTAAAASAPSFGGASTNASAEAAPASPKSPSGSSTGGNGLSPNGGGGGGANGGAATTTADATEPPFPLRLQTALSRQLQTYLDQSVPHHVPRWVGLAVLMLLYCVRVYMLEGWYIVTYGLGIFLLNLLIGFLTPLDDADGDPLLPTNSREAGEFRPFIRRLPEFKFWWSCTKAVGVALVMTFFQLFNVPVFWPILLVYFIVLFVLTMKRQIMHMWTHKYIPFSFGKPSYGAKGVAAGPPPKRVA